MKKNEEEVVRQLKWRLSERPTVESIEKLITLGVITKEDARKLLLDEEDVRPKGLKDLEKEIQLLRELVLDVAQRQWSPTIPVIIEKYIDRTPWRPWYAPYTTTYLTTSVGSSGTITNSDVSTSDIQAYGDSLAVRGAVFDMSAIPADLKSYNSN